MGRYARATLTKLGVWPQVSGRLVAAENVRAALEYLLRGEAPLGVVYPDHLPGGARRECLAGGSTLCRLLGER